MGKNDGKPRGKMSSYAFFVQTCREEHKKKHPGEQVVFAEFSKKCSEKWKAMSAKEKKRFEEMAEKDKVRFENEMASCQMAKGGRPMKRKRTKDPNAPKRSLSAFFFFCNEERGKVKAQFPSYGVGDIAKELGKRWEVCPNRPKFEQLAAKDKIRYEEEISAYRQGGSKKAKAEAPAAKKAADDDDEDEEEEEEEEDEESD